MKILMTGLSRSGNHPILHWIMAHTKGEFVHYNAVLSGSKDIRQRKSQIRLWRDGKEVGGKELKKFIDHIMSGGKEPENVVLSCENESMMESKDIWYKYFDKEPDIRVVVLRSYMNVMASRLKKAEPMSGPGSAWFRTGKREREIWKSHARAVYFPLSWTVIKYDKWCRSSKYRRILEGHLNISAGIDGDMDYVPRDANGSSFDGRKGQSGLELARKASERYKEILLPREIVDDIEAMDLSRRLFK